jgi:hypothetical protein
LQVSSGWQSVSPYGKRWELNVKYIQICLFYFLQELTIHKFSLVWLLKTWVWQVCLFQLNENPHYRVYEQDQYHLLKIE